MQIFIQGGDLKMLNKRITAFVMLVAILAMLPYFEKTALVETSIEYIDKNGKTNTQDNIIKLEDSKEDIIFTECWHYVDGTVEYSARLAQRELVFKRVLNTDRMKNRR